MMTGLDAERLVIRASAGTGKTFQLTNRYLRQLHLDASPNEILASTFTRKAAGEILERVLQRLAAAAASEPQAADLAAHLGADDFDRRRALQLLAQLTQALHQVQICTLDALFLRVAASLSLELQLMPGWSIIGDADYQPLFDQAIDTVLQEGDTNELQTLTSLLAHGDQARSVAEKIRDIVSAAHQLARDSRPDAWQWPAEFPRLTKVEIETEIEQLRMDRGLGKRIATANEKAAEAADAEKWDAFIDTGIAKKLLAGETTYYKKPIDPELCAVYTTLLKHARAWFYDRITIHTHATRQLSDHFDQQFSHVKRRAGGMLFDDVPRLLAAELRTEDQARVAYRLDSHIRHVLLDEFQDTSLTQWKAIDRLLLGGDTGRLQSFFCVGDTKQAIYGWRGGVAEIFDKVPKHVPRTEEAGLNESRRSWPAVIECVNNVFERLPDTGLELGEAAEAIRAWCRQFKPHETVLAREPDAGRRGHVRLLAGPTAPGKQPMHEFVADEVQVLSARCPGRTIGVLTRKNETASRIAVELRKRGIAASEEGGSPVADSAAVLALLSLLQLIDLPGDTVARFHVANSPLGKVVKLTDPKSEREAVRCGRTLRRQLAELGYGQTLDGIVKRILPCCSRRDVVRLRQVIELAWQFDAKRSGRTRDFIRLIDTKRVETPTEDRVRVMTIHGSKGLEFDIVVLPELDGQPQPRQINWSTDPETLEPDRVCTQVRTAVQPLLPDAFHRIFTETQYRQTTERLCLLYVAMTRAAHALHMIVPEGKPLKDGSKWYTNFAGILRATLGGGREAIAEQTLFELGDPAWHDHDLQHRPSVPTVAGTDTRRRPTTRLALAPMEGGRQRGLARVAPSSHRAAAMHIDQLIQPDSAAAKARGTVVHKWFEQIRWLDEALPTDAALRDALDDPACMKLDLDAMLAEFREALTTPAAKQILTPAAYQQLPTLTEAERAGVADGSVELQVFNERPFAMREQGELIVGTIDRLVLLRQHGKPVAADIIDFKTDRVSSPGALEEKRETYSPQLSIYRRAISRMYGLPEKRIRSRLYMTDAAAVVDVPPAPTP